MSVATVEVVADTNIVIWYFLESDKLTAAARDALETETTAGRPVGVSAWALVEIGYAAEKPSNPLTAEDRSAILAELAAPDSPFGVVPVDAEIAARVADVPREANADPGDRVLVATAEVLGARLVSADRTLPAMTMTPIIW
ncbi:MAG: type II toxin-antitoxin system VapC family toxin [Acidimicrobiia bacterium]